METIVPCTDCENKKLDLVQLGFRVIDCTAHPSRADFCIVRFEEPANVPQATAATTSTAAAATAVPAGAPAAAPVLTKTQTATAMAVVNVFETGEVLGDYGQVTLIAGDSGHLTFGRSQTTLGSGNLGTLLQQYCDNPGARFAARLSPLLNRFKAIDHTLDADLKLHNLLRATADDPVMRDTQDRFFDQVYWQPALRAARKLGLFSPLATAVVYDGHVHGAWATLRDRTTQVAGAPEAIGERAWTSAYVTTRRSWLANHPRADLRPTVYRMDAFQRLVDLGMWGLELPLVVRSCEISSLSLAAMPRNCYDGPQPGTRALALQAPLLRGLDVRLLQLTLSDRGADIRADGVFGQASLVCVKNLQAAMGQAATGALDAAAVAALVG